jgi:phage terminase small subunit
MARKKKKREIEVYDGSTPLKSVQQERFIQFILQGLPQYKAYEKAGYVGKSQAIVMANSTNLLHRNKKIASRLAYLREELERRWQAQTVELRLRVCEEIKKLAFSNMRDFVKTEDGEFVFEDWSNLSPDQTAAVESVKITKTTTTNRDGSREYTTQHTQFKLHPKTANLELLGKHLGIFAEDNKQQAAKTLIVFESSEGEKTTNNDTIRRLPDGD